MTAVNAELVAVVERSPAATDIHDRAAWIALFTADGRVEDPYGSRAHTGTEAIGRFYDTFIGPRRIVFHRDVDLVAGATVVRDLMLEIEMAPGVTLNVPMHLRYDLRPTEGDWRIERLRAHWELPTMMAPMLRHGVKSLPPSLRLVRDLLRNQGLGGSAGYLNAMRRPGKAARRCVATFLDAAVAGDHLTARRAMGNGAITHGEETPIAIAEFVDSMRGGRWTKMIATGDTVSASLSAPSGRGVIFCEIDGPAIGITQVDFFG